MPPRVFSRHALTSAIQDDQGRTYLSDREPYGFQNFPDNVQHVARTGDTLSSLAARYFTGFDRPDGLWWIIADFQPQPILDPTLALEEGTMIFVPSVRTVHEEIFSERRRQPP
jgi:hypothetical protein